jgi:ribonuclease Z
MAAGGTGADVDAVFLTHLHSDHIVDLFQLIISSWHQGRDRPQYIFGPKGTKRYVNGLLELWKPEFKQRIAHEKRSSAAGLGAEVVEIKAGEVFRAGEMTVSAVKVDHYPVRPAFGFLFETPEARLAISGDTTYCPELIEAARGVDVLVHEVYIHRGPVPSVPVEDRRSRNVQSYHTSSDVVGRVAREAEAGILLLSHFVPTRFDEEELLDQVSADFDGPILIGEDLMNIDVAQRRVLSWGMSLALGKEVQAPKPEAKLRARPKAEIMPRETKTRTRHII